VTGKKGGPRTWRNGTQPPSEWYPGAERLNDDQDVYVALGPSPAETIIWHWCTGTSRWMGAYIDLHTIVAREPLTIDPSLHMPDCCGWHGYIRAGRWEPVPGSPS
jgi:hypothetical protein